MSVISYMRDGKPVVPTRMRKLESRDCLTILSNASTWFARKEFSDGADGTDFIAAACDETVEFLKRNDKTYDEAGKEQDAPWVNTDIQFTKDDVRLELRRSILRTKTFSEGVYYLLRCLDRKGLLPIGAFSHADKCRDLAEFAIHEHLMAAHFAKEAAGDDEEALKRLSAGNISLSDLRTWYIYAQSTKLLVLRPITARMASCGLWNVAGSAKEGHPWVISAGPVAIHFHRKVFFPVIRHFHDAMTGKI